GALYGGARPERRHKRRVFLEEAHGGCTTAVVVFSSDLLIAPVEGQYAVGGPSSRGALTTGIPNTHAEAEAAFAAGPPAAEPGDPWQQHDNVPSPAEMGGLPKRQPGGSRADEHPPSGQDLWNTGSSSSGSVWETTRGSGATNSIDPGQDTPVVDPYDVEEETPRPE